MRTLFLLFTLLFPSWHSIAQFSFELKVDYGMQVGNTDHYSISGIILSGRIEKGKTYFLEDGTRLDIQTIISSKTATSVPVANSQEMVSLALQCKGFSPSRGDVLRAITTRPSYSGITKYHANQLPEGVLTCRLNGKLYRANTVSKPVYIKASNMLDLFFIAADQSVIWLQLNGFSDIETMPHNTKSDTSEKNHALVCKVAFMPKGYRPTDMPTNYKAYEDVRGNAGIIVTSIDRYKRTIALEFSGILSANKKLVEDGTTGLFYISEGKVDNIGWDEF